MSVLISAQNLEKTYGSTKAVDQVSFDVESGRIVGLIGPNGAGKTTLLNAVLGLTPFDGQLSVLGLDPFRQRKELMQRIAYVSDVAVLPKWMRVSNLLDLVERIHNNFSRSKADAYLKETKIKLNSKVSQLSKGMVVQLHLGIIMAIDAELLILDEPTLGLDILFRKDFYSRLLGDYYDGEKTILVTTHQVEELEHILTDVMFIDGGKLVLDESTESAAGRFAELMTSGESLSQARQYKPIGEREGFGKSILTFEDVSKETLREFGEVRSPSIADLFVAVVRGRRANA